MFSSFVLSTTWSFDRQIFHARAFESAASLVGKDRIWICTTCFNGFFSQQRRREFSRLLPQVTQNCAFVSCSLITMKDGNDWTRDHTPFQLLLIDHVVGKAAFIQNEYQLGSPIGYLSLSKIVALRDGFASLISANKFRGSGRTQKANVQLPTLECRMGVLGKSYAPCNREDICT